MVQATSMLRLGGSLVALHPPDTHSLRFTSFRLANIHKLCFPTCFPSAFSAFSKWSLQLQQSLPLWPLLSIELMSS